MPRSFLFLPQLLLLLLASAVLLCHPVPAAELPVAEFSVSPESGTVPLDVKLTDASNGDNVTRFWWFGDGAFSSAQDPEHIYTEPGSYTIRLSVSDTAGHASVEKRSIIARSGPVSLRSQLRHLSVLLAHPIAYGEPGGSRATQGYTEHENLASLHAGLVRPLVQGLRGTGYDVTFRESGLPPGLDWSVILVNDNGARLVKNSSAAAISFSGLDGSYSYSVPLVNFGKAGKKKVNISAVIPTGRVDITTGTIDVRFSHFEPEWSGYLVTANVTDHPPLVTSVQGSWTVPELSGNPPDMTPVFQWIGIGGFFPGDIHNLIQAGTASQIGGWGSLQYNYAWVELLPDTAEPIPPEFVVFPKDTMLAEIHEENPGVWNVSLEDLTQRWHYQRTYLYNSSKDSAEWVLENPSYAGETHELADFGIAGFGNGSLSSGKNEATIGPMTGPAGSFLGFSITMVHDNVSRAIPSELSPEGSFTITGYRRD